MVEDHELEHLRFEVRVALEALEDQFFAIEKRLVSIDGQSSAGMTYRGQINLTEGWPADPQRGDMWRVVAPVALALASPTEIGVSVNAGDLIIWDGLEWDVIE